MVAGLHAGDARADFAHDPRALMAEHAGEQTLRIEPVQRVGIGVADAGRLDLNQHLARPGAFEIELDDLEWPFGFEGDGGAGFHGIGSPLIRLRLGGGRAAGAASVIACGSAWAR